MKKINRKLFIKKTGVETKIGDVLLKMKALFGMPLPSDVVEITEDNVQSLIDEGILEEKLVEEESKISEPSVEDKKADIECDTEEEQVLDLIGHMADRLEWSNNKVIKFLRNLLIVDDSAVYKVLLDEASLIFEEDYEDSIESSKEVWVVNSFNHKVDKVKNPSAITCWDEFAAFRSEEEALLGDLSARVNYWILYDGEIFD